MSRSESASLAELLCAVSFASDMGMGQPMEHGLKTAWLGLQLADTLGLPMADRQAVFYGSLVKDVGCTACAAFFVLFFGGDDIAPPQAPGSDAHPLEVGTAGWGSARAHQRPGAARDQRRRHLGPRYR